jgi:competence protein ComEC
MKYLIWPLLILLIFVRYITTEPDYHDGDNVRITTTVLTDPVNYPSGEYLKIAGLKTYLPLSSNISFGDKIVVEGLVQNGKLENPKIINIQKGVTVLSGFRNSIISFYSNNLPAPYDGILSGVIFGDKSGLSQDFYNSVNNLGVSFLLGATGIKLALIISFIFGTLTIFLPRKWAIPFVIFGIILYIFVSGLNMSLIRAAIMTSFIFLGQESGRLVGRWRVFFITIAVMLIIFPDWLTDSGFLLSITALLGIMLLTKPFEKILRVLPKFFKENFSVALAAQIGITPIQYVIFGQVNIWSPIASVLLIWTIPWVMALGMVGGIAGLIFPAFGKIILYLSFPLLWWFTAVVSVFT